MHAEADNPTKTGNYANRWKSLPEAMRPASRESIFISMATLNDACAQQPLREALAGFYESAQRIEVVRHANSEPRASRSKKAFKITTLSCSRRNNQRVRAIEQAVECAQSAPPAHPPIRHRRRPSPESFRAVASVHRRICHHLVAKLHRECSMYCGDCMFWIHK